MKNAQEEFVEADRNGQRCFCNSIEGNESVIKRNLRSSYGNLWSWTTAFGLSIIGPYSSRSGSTISQTIGKQCLRSGTLIGSHYTDAYRARPTAKFVRKIELLLQELDETPYLLELGRDADVIKSSAALNVQQEANVLIATFVASVKTAKLNSKKSRIVCP